MSSSSNSSNSSNRSNSNEDSDSLSDISCQSLPEQQDLENTVLKRFVRYHPKDLIPPEEKLIALNIRAFNDIFIDVEEEFENENEKLLNLEKKMKKNKKRKQLEKIRKILKDNRTKFLNKKDQLENYYSFVSKTLIKNHPDPPEQYLALLKLLEKNSSTLHAITLQMSMFSYIDSDLSSSDDDDNLADIEYEDYSSDDE